MATHEFKLPDVGEGVAEGELVRWLVDPGDEVTEDQPVAEVETDKAMVEVPSPFDGTVKELRAEEGEVVPVGTVIITFEVDEGEVDEGEVDESGHGGTAESDDDGAGPRTVDADTTAAVTPSDDEGTTEAESDPAAANGRVFAPPSARRLARELGVDLGAVSGSGPGGRVTEADVRTAGNGESGQSEDEGSDGPRDTSQSGESAVTNRGDEADESETTPTADAAGRAETLAAPATRRVADELGVDIDDVPATETRDGEAFVTEEAVREYAASVTASASEAETKTETERSPAPTGTPEADERAADAAAGPQPGERVPYRGVRRTIGQQMERSKYTAPHVTHHDDADVGELVELRSEYKRLAAERGVKLTYLPFVMKAASLALREFPYVNSTLDEEREEILLKDEYNVGVATDTEVGLMVPVVRDVDRKGILEIARETNELTTRARDRSIEMSEMKGGTFTVTNVGAIGGEYATPIINYPEVAILALGAVRKRPRVVDDEVVPRHTLPLSLSIDHRVVDGAVAARFTNELKTYLENPKLLLLE